MEDILKKSLFWVVAMLTLFNVGVFVIGKVVIDKAADAVIEKLEKEYSPSPYGPGLDPDLVDPIDVKKQRLYMDLARLGSDVTQNDEIQKSVASSDRWFEEWEADRGFPEFDNEY